ncbi:S8 family serine peptidase [Aquipuribacter sp. SD81]|uniref:S8 family serine peptidase n=1 Tax=Aquipuribacter sp. SD81 TaxID=3127703 RepID=UPI003016E5D3
MTPRPARGAARTAPPRPVVAGLLAGLLAVLVVPVTASSAGAAGTPGGATADGAAPVLPATSPAQDETVPAALVAEAARTVTVLTEDGDGGLDVDVVETGSPESASALAASAQQEPDVIAAAVAVPVRATDGDPLRAQQWPLTELQAERAWTTTTGREQVVAVLDTGVDASHPDLRGVVLAGTSTTGSGRDGRRDVDGHGTHVSGVVAAVAGNATGVAGLAPGVRVLPVQVLDDSGNGLSSWVSAGIVWAADHGADVINLSLGGPQSDPVLAQAVDYARSKGVVVVAASGNEYATSVSYPAAYPGVLAVGATSSSRQVPSFSNRGSALDVVAPGVGVLSTVPGGGYEAWSGTSMASPYAAASAALLRAAQPALDEAQVRARLEGTARDLGARGWDSTSGYGLVDPVAALADSTTDLTPPGPVTLGATEVGTGAVRLRWTPPADGDVAGVVVVRAAGLRTVASPADGTVVYSGARTDVRLEGLAPRNAYSFAVFARDGAGNVGTARLVQVQGVRLSVSARSSSGATLTTATSGQSVVLGATVGDHVGKPLTGVPVTFQARSAGSVAWSTVARVTSSDGRAAATLHPTRSVEYRAVVSGTAGAPGRSGAATGPRRLDVRAATTSTGPRRLVRSAVTTSTPTQARTTDRLRHASR